MVIFGKVMMILDSRITMMYANQEGHDGCRKRV